MISIVIVNWNGKDLIAQCLRSIKNFIHDIDYEVIVSDNGSGDGSQELIKSDYNWVTLIENNENLGFSKGNNVALPHVKGDYILFLNPDTELLSNIPVEMIDLLKDDSVGVVGCRQLNADRTIQYSAARFPTPLVSIMGNYALKNVLNNGVQEVDWVMGAFMLMRTGDVLKVGGFNPSYFMYSEDMELCYKIHKLGKKVIYFDDYSIVHYYNQSGKLMWNNKREEKVKASLYKFIEDNYSKSYSLITKWAIVTRYWLKKIVSKNA